MLLLPLIFVIVFPLLMGNEKNERKREKLLTCTAQLRKQLFCPGPLSRPFDGGSIVGEVSTLGALNNSIRRVRSFGFCTIPML